MRQIRSLIRKELEGYFGSPLAIIFLGAFLAVELFIFFSVETFFARGIADVRPMFRWMPVLLLFLLSAMTMRQWSEEQRSGTLEVLLTLPVSAVQLVAAKFLAVMAMIGLALLLTLPLPVTVSLLGPLDWGPVIGGYLAALLLAAAYAAIGLFVSSRTDNQIVALILSVLLGGVFYLVGTSGITSFTSAPVSDILWALGTGSRFESIERGVIDLRDLIYYLSLSGIFLTLNVVSLDSLRWSRKQAAYRRSMLISAGLIVLNLLLVNVWLAPLQGLRLDLTAQQQYTLSQVTKNLLGDLSEPLLVRAYISNRTHPLLAPLTPQIRDMLREYEIAGDGQVTVEVVDPASDPAIEAEANQTYGISPTPFQIAGRYEASVINSYFDILVRYGDQSLVLNFQDIIEVTQANDGMDVGLRNLEYDLTSAIKKVVFGFQSVDAVLVQLELPVQLTLYASLSTMPEFALPTAETMRQVGETIANDSNGKLLFELVDPDALASGVTRQDLIDVYGMQFIPVDIFSDETFILAYVLENSDQAQVIYPPGELTEGEIRSEIESALKTSTSGFLKVIGLWTPPQTPTVDMFGNQQDPVSTYQAITEQLRQEYEVRSVDLSTGVPPSGIDVLVLVAPQNLTAEALFAIDQYLMRGGAVVVATSNSTLQIDPFTGLLGLQPLTGGIQELLQRYGVILNNAVVVDQQNMPFPLLVTRDVGGFQVQEVQAVDYPLFVEVREDGMLKSSPVMSNIPAVTFSWASPLNIPGNNEDVTAEVLMYSSANSWLRTEFDIQPNFELYPDLGFAVNGVAQSYPLAVALQGSFESFYSDKPSPLAGLDSGTVGEGPSAQSDVPVITRAAEGARLVVFGSSAFVDDFVLQLSARLSQDRYLNNLALMQNAVDWSVQDLDLLTIRARGNYTRLLNSMEAGQQTFWEVANYVIALLALIALYVLWQYQRRTEPAFELVEEGHAK